jgi:hypothetical protein
MDSLSIARAPAGASASRHALRARWPRHASQSARCGRYPGAAPFPLIRASAGGRRAATHTHVRRASTGPAYRELLHQKQGDRNWLAPDL